jgi:hypothetical protein
MGSSSLIEKRGAKNKTLSWALGHKSSHGLLYEIQSTPTDPLYTSNSHFLTPPPHPTQSHPLSSISSDDEHLQMKNLLRSVGRCLLSILSHRPGPAAPDDVERESERERSSLVRSN